MNYIIVDLPIRLKSGDYFLYKGESDQLYVMGSLLRRIKFMLVKTIYDL